MLRKLTSDRCHRLWPLTSRQWPIWLVLLAGIVAGGWLPGKVIVATSDSLDRRIFWKVPAAPGRIAAGDYLLFRLRDERHFAFLRPGLTDNDLLVKKVGCLPGDMLSRNRANTFYCNQTALGTALVQDSRGKTLPEFHFSGRIPADRYFMVGTNPRSFDSRYFGFVHADDFIAKGIPLL